MAVSKYITLLNNPPKLEIVENAREVIFTTISCMCDNVHYITFKKDKGGDFSMSGGGFALSNWQFKHAIHEITWKADEGNWTEVIKMINSSTEKIEKVISR